MRILIDLTSLADNFSGIERYAACLAQEMVRKEENDYILIFKKEVHPLFTDAGNNVKKIVIKACNKLVFNQIKLPFEIYKHKANWYLFLAFPVPIFLFRKNMVSTIHDICCWDCPETMTWLSKWYFRISHKVAMLKCRRIITISRFSENRIVDKLKYMRSKIWLIYCGVDDTFLNYPKPDQDDERIKEKYHLPDRYLLSLSTLEPRKNLNLLVEAYSELVLKEKYTIPLVLVGRKGWKIDELFNKIDENVKKQILFTGFAADEDLPVIYRSASLFIFPSMYEGFGMPPLEAMACGVNILSSDASSLPEVLGNAAEYFTSGCKDELITKIKTFNFKSKNLNDLKNQVNKFSWKRESDKLLTLIKNNG